MLTMDAIDHPMMKSFTEQVMSNDPSSLFHDHLNDWLNLTAIASNDSIYEGFPVEEFECLHVPKTK